MAFSVDSVFTPIESASQSATDAARAVASGVARGFESTASAATSMARQVASSLSSVAQSARQTGENIIGRAVEVTNQVIERARTVAVSLGTSLVSGLLSLRQTLISAVGSAISTVASGFSRIGSFVSGAVSAALGGLGVLASGLSGSGIGGALSSFGASVVARVSAIFGAVTGGLNTLASSISSAITGAISSATGLVSGLISSVVSGLSSVFSSLLSAGPIGIGAAAALAALLGNFAIAFLSKTLSTAGTALGNAPAFLATLPAKIAPILSGLVSSIGGVIGAVGATIRSGLGTVADIAKTAFSTLGAWASSAMKWVSGLAQGAFGFASRGVSAVVSSLSSLASSALSLGIAFGKILGVGTLMGAFGTAVYAASKAAMEFAQNAKTLAAMTGLGQGKSASLLNAYAAQGVGASAVQGAFGDQSSFAFRMKARVYGLSGYDDENFGEKLATRYQGLSKQGEFGQIRARSMMKVLGLDNPEFLRLATTSPATQRENSNYAHTINSNLGLSEGQLAHYAEAVPALVSRVGVAFNGVVMKLAGEALPMVESVLNVVTKLVGDNAGNIGSLISDAVSWMFVKAPVIMMEGVTTVVGMVSGALGTLVGWGEWIVNALPKVLETGASAIANILRGWSETLSAWAPGVINGFAGFLAGLGESVAGWVENVGGAIADQLDNFANWIYSSWSNQNSPFRTVALSIAGALDGIIDSTTNFVGRMASTGAILGNFLVSGGGGLLGKMLANSLGIKYQSPSTMAATATAGLGKSHLQDDIRRLMAGPMMPRFAANVADRSDALRSRSKEIADNLNASFGDMAAKAARAGANVTNSLTRGLDRAAGAIATRDGKHNIGRDAGDLVAGYVKPALDVVSQMNLSVKSVSDYAQIYKASLGTEEERKGKWDELISATKDVSSTIREESRRGNGSSGAAFDAITGYMLKSFAQEQGRAVRSYGGGGTG